MTSLPEDSIICTMCADSLYARRTASDAMTIEEYLMLPHVAPSPMVPGNPGVIDAFLERQRMRRHVAVQSLYFGLIPYMLLQTALVLTTGRQFMRFYEKTLALKSFTLPVKFPPMRFYQRWHERVRQAPEHKWLRDQVSAAATALAR